jgi:hypothetical protein
MFHVEHFYSAWVIAPKIEFPQSASGVPKVSNIGQTRFAWLITVSARSSQNERCRR